MLVVKQVFFYGLPVTANTCHSIWVNRKKTTILLLTCATDFLIEQ